MGYLILIFWLLVLPVCAGSLFQYHNGFDPGMRFVKGQFLLWAVFQLVTVPVILGGGTLETVMAFYLPPCFLLALLGLIFMIRRKEWTKIPFFSRGKREKSAKASAFTGGERIKTSAVMHGGREEFLLLFAVLALWLFQMGIVVTQAIYDGDDSFYMAVANLANTNGSLYQVNPYSMGSMELNYRYILAPFPVWVALLARVSGLHTLTVGHVALGISLISMSYLIYWQIGRELFEKKVSRLRFMLCLCLLYLWGNTSIHTAESFLITRSRQGKALVCGLVLPAFVGVLLHMGNALDQKEKISPQVWIYASCIMLTGCLGSAFGGAIVLLFWGGLNLMWLIAYRRIRSFGLAIVSALPAAAFSLLYLLQ
ncbi:MAG: DUF6077 domain-containing protein [Lachnospiraceae bacterium]|nr:DUF6077 domain-containing protein [Lachnospiraceae bacterium]